MIFFYAVENSNYIVKIFEIEHSGFQDGPILLKELPSSPPTYLIYKIVDACNTKNCFNLYSIQFEYYQLSTNQ